MHGLARGEHAQVELGVGARIVAHTDQTSARGRCTLVLEPADERLALPRVCAVPAGGTLELARLAPGRWSWMLYASLASVEVLSLLDARQVLVPLASGAVTLVDGATSELVLSEPAARPPVDGASLAGTVCIDGRPAGGLSVDLWPLDDDLQGEKLSTQATAGRFDVVIH